VGAPTAPTIPLIRHRYRLALFRYEKTEVPAYCHSSLWDGDALDFEAAMVDFAKPAILKELREGMPREDGEA
jgi:hypothetical protein